jgi:hypothetical protein
MPPTYIQPNIITLIATDGQLFYNRNRLLASCRPTNIVLDENTTELVLLYPQRFIRPLLWYLDHYLDDFRQCCQEELKGAVDVAICLGLTESALMIDLIGEAWSKSLNQDHHQSWNTLWKVGIDHGLCSKLDLSTTAISPFYHLPIFRQVLQLASHN